MPLFPGDATMTSEVTRVPSVEEDDTCEREDLVGDLTLLGRI